MINSIENSHSRVFLHHLENTSKKILIKVAKSGLASSITGYCIAQLSGAKPLNYTLAFNAVHIASFTDSLICKTMLNYGRPSATKKVIALNISLATGFLFFYKTLGYFDSNSRDEAIKNIIENLFIFKVGSIILGSSILLLASDYTKNPIMKKIQETAIEAMQFRADDIAWTNL